MSKDEKTGKTTALGPEAAFTPALTTLSFTIDFKLDAEPVDEDDDHPEGTIVSSSLQFDDEEHFAQVADDVGFTAKSFTLVHKTYSEAFDAPDGYQFSVRDVLQAIQSFEKAARNATTWQGGRDLHHTFFEGVKHLSGPKWRILWGS